MAVASWTVEPYYNQRVKNILNPMWLPFLMPSCILSLPEGLKKNKQNHNIHQHQKPYDNHKNFIPNHYPYKEHFVSMTKLSRKTGLSPPPSPQYFYTDRSKAVLLLWFLTVICSCCPYLYFGSAIMLVTYFVNFR